MTRWSALFDDLEGQADALDNAMRTAEVDERARIEFGTLGVQDRLRAASGMPVRVTIRGSLSVAGAVRRVGPDWVLVDEGAGREALIVLAAVQTISGLGRAAAVPGSGGRLSARLTVRAALRGIARDRSATRVHLVGGDVLDVTLDRVGADFVEAARHAPGEPRRRRDVREVVLVPLVAIAAVRREAG